MPDASREQYLMRLRSQACTAAPDPSSAGPSLLAALRLSWLALTTASWPPMVGLVPEVARSDRASRRGWVAIGNGTCAVWVAHLHRKAGVATVVEGIARVIAH